MRNFVGILFFAFSFFLAADKVPSQQKVDEVVADEIVQFEHGEDAESAVRVLRAQGVTDEMLGSAYLKIVRKKMFAVRRSVDAANLNNAMWGLSQYGTENQLTNLLYVAENATDEITVTSAVFAYHAREGRSPRFLDWAQRILRQPNRSRRIKNDIWSCLSRDIKAKECSEKCRSRILRMARESLETDLEGAFYQDRILAAHDAAYRTGTERRKIAEKVLSKQNLNEVVRRHFGSVTGKDPANISYGDVYGLCYTSSWNRVTRQWDRFWMKGMVPVGFGSHGNRTPTSK